MGRFIFNKKYLIRYRRDLRKHQTTSEALIWFHIRNSGLGYKIRRQHSIGNYIADFYCPSIRLAIELDGWTHHDEKVYEKDLRKMEYLNSLQIKTIRFDDSEVYEDLDEVLECIYQECEKRKNTLP